MPTAFSVSTDKLRDAIQNATSHKMALEKTGAVNAPQDKDA